MRTLIAIILLILFQSVGFAFEWEGGIRETYITKDSFSFNSDTTARILNELIDRGHKGISLQPRLAWNSEKSLFYMPVHKTSLPNIAIAATRIQQADGTMTIRPLIYDNPGLNDPKVAPKINPRRADLALISYGQLISLFAQVSREHQVKSLVVGSGLVHLLSDKTLIPRFEDMLRAVKKSVGVKTKVSLEVVGTQDLLILMNSIKTDGLKLKGIVDSISLVLDPEMYSKGLKVDELKKMRLLIEALLPQSSVNISRLTIPGCKIPFEESMELYCPEEKLNYKLQVDRFLKMKQDLLTLEQEGIQFDAVEIMEATTDYEPNVPDPRYPYYNPLFKDQKIYELPVKTLEIAPAWPLPKVTGTKNACIYYDQKDAPNAPDTIGEIHAMMLQSLLGAFPDWVNTRKPVDKYSAGEFEKCNAIFYLATNFGQEPPYSFVKDLAKLPQDVSVVWFNYKLTLLTEEMKKRGKHPGFEAPVLIQADSVPSAENPNPGFFSQFDYKGETFFKLSSWNPISNNFEANPEIHAIQIQDNSQVEVLSNARHDKTNKTTPYAVKSNNLWYIADTPFSFVHYEDRFYIFCDLLWDILKETPPTERVALLRVEDINPKQKLSDLKWVSDYLANENVPYSIALIPFFSNLFGDNTESNVPVFKPITKFPDFIGQLKYAINRGANIVMHGTMHSVGCLISGYDGVSGADYEFWLYPENTPLPFDSIDWVTKRLELGIKTLQELNIRPVAFEAPHYAASVLDYYVFGKMFQWQYHRSIFMPFKMIKDTGLPRHLMAFECKNDECRDERRKILRNLKVEANYKTFSGIASPFITQRDIYDQSIIPETLGMIDFVFYPAHTWRPVNKPEDIIRRAKKLKVIRGAVASFFWHLDLLDPVNLYYQEVPGSFEEIGGKKSLSKVIDASRDLGYVFKSTSDKTLFPDEAI